MGLGTGGDAGTETRGGRTNGNQDVPPVVNGLVAHKATAVLTVTFVTDPTAVSTTSSAKGALGVMTDREDMVNFN
jgi:hypothetical protein